MDRPKKIGVVLEGGACRSAFQAGVLDELDRQGVRFSHVTGVSAGALNGCAVVQGRTHELLDMWRDLEGSRFINLKNLAWNWSPFNMSRITLEIIQKHFCMEALRRSSIDFAVVTTRLPTWQRHVYTNRQEVDMVAVLRASNLIPVIHSRPVFINGVPHIDGGFVDNNPLDVPLQAGCDLVVIIVNNHRGRVYRRLLPPRVDPLQAYRDEVVVIHPPTPLPMGRFDFRVEKMEEVFKIGREAALKWFRSGRLG